MKRRINAIALILCSLAIILLGTHSVANTQESQFLTGKFPIIAFTRFPTPVSNVEGTAVAKVGEQLIFLYAERAEGKPATEIRWASLSLQPLKIGSIEEVTFTNPIPGDSEVRLISAMEIDRESRLYVASTSDPANEGPFSSIIWQIGAIAENENGKPQIVLCDTPKRLANVDGFKVEGLAIRELNNSKGEIFVGVDDENYGGTIRPLPISF